MTDNLMEGLIMVTIRATVHKNTKDRACCWCERYIDIGEKYLRIFGMAEEGDPPYEIFQHLKCIGYCMDEKILEALKKANIEFEYKDCDVIIK